MKRQSSLWESYMTYIYKYTDIKTKKRHREQAFSKSISIECGYWTAQFGLS